MMASKWEIMLVPARAPEGAKEISGGKSKRALMCGWVRPAPFFCLLSMMASTGDHRRPSMPRGLHFAVLIFAVSCVCQVASCCAFVMATGGGVLQQELVMEKASLKHGVMPE